MREKREVVLWRVQVESAIHCLKQVADSLKPGRRALTKTAVSTLRTLRPVLPYCLHPVGNDGRCILLNRDYLPVGNTEKKWIDYDQYLWAHFTPPAGLLDKNGRLYFFGDDTAPWDSLPGLQRLIERLTKLLGEM